MFGDERIIDEWRPAKAVTKQPTKQQSSQPKPIVCISAQRFASKLPSAQIVVYGSRYRGLHPCTFKRKLSSRCLLSMLFTLTFLLLGMQSGMIGFIDPEGAHVPRKC